MAVAYVQNFANVACSLTVLNNGVNYEIVLVSTGKSFIRSCINSGLVSI